MNPTKSTAQLMDEFNRNQRKIDTLWVEKNKKNLHPKASKEHSSKVITKFHDKFDYFA